MKRQFTLFLSFDNNVAECMIIAIFPLYVRWSCPIKFFERGYWQTGPCPYFAAVSSIFEWCFWNFQYTQINVFPPGDDSVTVFTKLGKMKPSVQCRKKIFYYLLISSKYISISNKIKEIRTCNCFFVNIFSIDLNWFDPSINWCNMALQTSHLHRFFPM